MSMTHAEALRRLPARADGLLPAQDSAELEEHLQACAECRQASQRLDELEKRLAGSLQQRYPLEEPDEGQVQAVMQRVSRNLTGKEPRLPRPPRLRLPAGLAWSGAALLVVALLAWSIRNLLPAQPRPLSTPISLASASPSPAETVAAPAALDTVSPPAAASQLAAPQPAAPVVVSQPAGLFPTTEFIFQVDFPAAPQTLPLYRQSLSEPVTVESARAFAAQMGILGGVYQSTGEGGETIIDVSDGRRSLRFISTTGVFIYADAQRQRQNPAPGAPPTDQWIAAAVDFLRANNLLDHPYRAVTYAAQPGRVDLLPEIEGRPVIFGIGEPPADYGWATLELSADLQPSVLYYARQQFEPVGEFPLLSAEQAWQRLTRSDALSFAQYAVLAPEQPSTYSSWHRSRSVGQFQHLYGYAVRLASAEPGGSDLVLVNNLPLRGDTGSLPTGSFLHLWGAPEIDERGVLWFALQGWEVSTIAETPLEGVVERQGEQVFVKSEQGSYLLPDAPAELPGGAALQGWGVILPDAPARFEWEFLSSGQYPNSYSMTRACGGAGGGGGGGPVNANFGGGSFKLPYLESAPRPTPTAPVSPFQVGQRVEGWTGTVTIQDFLETTGLRREISFSTLRGFEFEEWHFFYLEGSGLGGIEPYQNLPVRVWGQVSGFAQDAPLIEVERFEPLYPGVTLQEFAGTESEVIIDGQPALLLTTQDGAQYIEEQSLGYGEEMRIGRPGDLVEIEGYLVPDLTLGGFAVIRATSGGVPPDGEVYDAQIHTIDMRQGGEKDVASAMAGVVTIDTVELAYAGSTLQRCPPTAMDDDFLSRYLTLQPVWVFKGTFADGRRFEVQVQALPDEYLE